MIERDSPSIEQKIRKSNIVGFSRTILAIPVYFVLTPFVINAIGKELYGLWSLNTVIWTILYMGDFGFQSSLVHFTAMDLDDHPRLSSLFNTVYFCFLTICVAFVICILIFNDFIVLTLLKIDPKYYQEATFVVVSSAVGFAIRFMAAPYQGIIEGNQRVYYSQKVSLFWLFFNLLATLVGLYMFPSIYTIGVINVVGNAFIFWFFFADARRRYTYARIEPRLFRLSTLKYIFPYSIWIQLGSMLIAFREPLVKTIIARKYGLDGLASFEIVYRLTIQCMSFVVVPLLTVLPVASNLHDRLPELHGIVKKYATWVAGILIVPSIAVWFFSDVFIRIWLGKDFEVVSAMLPWIFTSFAVYYLGEPLYKSIQGIGESMFSACSQAIFLGTLTILWLLMPQSWGIQSISYAFLAAGLAFFLSNVLIYRRSIASCQAPLV